MPIILSLLIFSIRIAFSLGNATVETLPNFLIENKECIEYVPINDRIATLIICEHSHSDAVLEESSEEESENEQLVSIIEKLVSNSFKKLYKTTFLAGFNSRAKQGNLHFYDLFHSWKVYLS